MPDSAIISIGNEILLGKTLNTNLAWLAAELALLGVPTQFALTVKDEPEAIEQALAQCWGKYDVVITTGGLGPTDDDITKKSIADYFGKELVFDEEVWNHVQSLFARRGLATPAINRNQALVPEGFSALTNDRGTAPGLHFTEPGKHFFAFAGVPLEMRRVFELNVRGIIQNWLGNVQPVVQRTLHTFGISESALAEILKDLQVPEDVSFAWLPQTGRVDLRFYGKNVPTIEDTIRRCLPPVSAYVWGHDDDTPASVLHSLLRAKGMDISAAESCTGGLLLKMLTDLPGASDIVVGGVVSYANAVKVNTLKVNQETLDRYGAVSEQCALEMVRGIKTLTGSAVAISVTGIAGPDGGSEQKPVGTVWYGFSVLQDEWCIRQIFTGDRETIRFKASEYAILHLIKHLQG